MLGVGGKRFGMVWGGPHAVLEFKLSCQCQAATETFSNRKVTIRFVFWKHFWGGWVLGSLNLHLPHIGYF